MDNRPADDDYFKQHDSAILEQQRRFRLNVLKLKREQQLHMVKPSEQETRGTSHDQLPTEHRGKTIGMLPSPQKSDIMNIYVNNRLVNRSFNSFEQVIKSVKTIPKRQRGMSEAAVHNKQAAQFSMIIPFIVGSKQAQKQQRKQQESKESKQQKVKQQPLATVLKLQKTASVENTKKDKYSVYKTRKLSSAKNQPEAVNRKLKLKADQAVRRITERVDTSGATISRNLDEIEETSRPQKAKHYLGKRLQSTRQSPDEHRMNDSRSRELSPRLRESFDSSRQIKVESILKRRSETQDFEVFISQFSFKMNYPPGVKLFIFRSHDEHIRRLLLKMGWVQNVVLESHAFHLKWTINDTPDCYSGLFVGHQYFNHFANSFKLTTKLGLHLNFYKPYRSMISHVYPRSFDLQNEQQQFVEEYERTAVLCMLRKHIRYFLSKGVTTENPDHRKPLQQILQESSFSAETFREEFQINIPIVVQMCMYLENWRCIRQQLPEPFVIEKKTVDKLVGFSRVQPPYEIYSTIKKSELQFNNPPRSPQSSPKKIIFSSDFRRYTAASPFGTPDDALVQLMFEYSQYFGSQLPYYFSDGENNVWIVKAAASSKGAGISLEAKLTTILEKGKDNKIVQKYVQNCLLFREIGEPEKKNILNRKFDIRQWVLVRSWSPLQVYFYSDFYLRICADEYDISDLKNPYRHLTNYSRNKSHFNQPKDSVMKSSDFKALLRSTFNVEYDRDIQPALKAVVVRSLRSYQGVVKPNPSCFEMFGYDFLLTEEYRPLLLCTSYLTIEVNMSPACSERTPWLTDMLDTMAAGLLSLVLPKRYFDMGNQANRWKMIYQG